MALPGLVPRPQPGLFTADVEPDPRYFVFIVSVRY
jgi:hypothetical protein